MVAEVLITTDRLFLYARVFCVCAQPELELELEVRDGDLYGVPSVRLALVCIAARTLSLYLSAEGFSSCHVSLLLCLL